MKLVYIASPYTLGDTGENVQAQFQAAHTVMDLGHCPVAPLLDHFLHMHRPRPYQDWIDCCLAKVRRCDIVWRLPGESPGAEKEVAAAEQCGIPVACNMSDLKYLLNK